MCTSHIFKWAPAVLLCVLVALAVPSQGQVLDGVPHLISYQGRLTDSVGSPVTDGEYVVTFAIWSDSTSTSPTDREWISPSCTVLVVNGLFNWQLGSKEGLPPWTVTNEADLWLGIQVASDPEITPRTRLCSAPYAYKAWQADYAEYADSAGIALDQLLAYAGIENLTVDNQSKVRITFPITFSDAGSVDLSSSAIVMSGAEGVGNPPRIISTTVTQTYADLTLQCWNGSSWVNMTQDDIVQVSYTAIER